MLPYWLLKLFPELSIEMLLLWIPVYVAGIVCVPLVLIGRFMVVMHGVFLPHVLLELLTVITIEHWPVTTIPICFRLPFQPLPFISFWEQAGGNLLNFALAAALTLYLYRFFYASGQAITGALAVAYIGYSIGLVVLEYFFCHNRNWKKAISSDTSTLSLNQFFLIAFAAYAEAWSYGVAIEARPGKFTIGLFYFCCQQFGFCLGSLSVKYKFKKFGRTPRP